MAAGTWAILSARTSSSGVRGDPEEFIRASHIIRIHNSNTESELSVDKPRKQFEEWTRVEATVKSRIQLLVEGKEALWLELPTGTHIQLACNWFQGIFPDRTSLPSIYISTYSVYNLNEFQDRLRTGLETYSPIMHN